MILTSTHLDLNPMLQFAALCTHLVFPWSHVNALGFPPSFLFQGGSQLLAFLPLGISILLLHFLYEM